MNRLFMAMIAAACLLSSSAEARSKRLPWCGIFMGKHLGKPARSLWIARNWAREGTSAGGPAIGAVVVWRHHVGIITGRTESGMWVVLSGNDGGAVRNRPRSVSNAIAFRWVS